MAEAPCAATVQICLAHCAVAGQVTQVHMRLPEGSTVQQALLGSGIAELQEELDWQDVGIWGRACAMTQALKDGDRVEIYRPLLVDPKVARRERFAQQGSRGAGLFARDPKT